MRGSQSSRAPMGGSTDYSNGYNNRAPIDGPAEYPPVHDKRDLTGLLTRFVPEKLRHGKFYRWFLRFTRILQFLSSVISLGIFSQRLYKVYRLVNRVKRRRGVNSSMGAVEGILAAAVLYTLISMLVGCIKKSANPGGRALRWVWVILDLLFVGAFIAAAVLTRPNGGLAGVGRCYNPTDVINGNTDPDPRDDTCNLPWGTFILAIISTLLHAITASFHEVKEHRRKNKTHNEKVVHDHQQPTGNIPYQQQRSEDGVLYQQQPAQRV